MFLIDLTRFPTRNQQQSKGQSPGLTWIITHRCDGYGHTILDCGLRPGEVGFALHPSTSMAYRAGRAGIAELEFKTQNSE
jgi:hypothetical protein